MCSLDQPLPRRQEISGDVDSLAASSPGSAAAADLRQQQCMAYTTPADVHLELDRSSWDHEQDILNYVQSKVCMNSYSSQNAWTSRFQDALLLHLCCHGKVVDVIPACLCL